MRAIKDFQTLQREQGTWAEKTFPGQAVTAKIKHLRKEVEELLADPQDKSELADVFLLFLDICRKQQVTPGLLLEIAVAKFQINQAREWGPPDADGICEHKRQAWPGPNGGFSE